MWVGMIE